ncbi:hypothetical protein G7Y85_16875 [Solimonas terrae]|uniref:PGAP1-like protein n=2 Tax=Solimonas terrae TaxID=1396819 RepID=A0A6M2BWW0_9GAMM|nr:hypothetical protein [Solimonas terrae]
MTLAAPYYPIIYVRGYAMTQSEIDDTSADPFCGFNLGSTVFRATADYDRARKFVFESPMVRLATDFNYRDVFENGHDIVDDDWPDNRFLDPRSVIIFRYYEQASKLLGSGKTPSIEKFAQDLDKLVLRVRDLVCGNPDSPGDPDRFRCHLVAHSMGGLVVRAFLQNVKLGSAAARRCVDKVFTYATPHNGIDVAGVNVPKWLTLNDISNFDRARMADYLDLKTQFKKTGRVDWLPQDGAAAFPASRVFCMIGTNRSDYEVAAGAARTFVGHGSDGLVRIENASLAGFDKEGVESPCARAYTYRSHSGYFGIVNSEEAYQNLVRFLFGDTRADIWLDVDGVTLPKAIADKAGVSALYQFEMLASVRGKAWTLSRRVAEEDSVACRTHQQLTTPQQPGDRTVYLSTVFLDKRWRSPAITDDSVAYRVVLNARTPDYEIERKLWLDQHYEGATLFRSALLIELFPPKSADEQWAVYYAWEDSKNPTDARSKVAADDLLFKDGQLTISFPFDSGGAPGIKGRLRFLVSTWNG